jgi:hypothetical protein
VINVRNNVRKGEGEEQSPDIGVYD